MKAFKIILSCPSQATLQLKIWFAFDRIIVMYILMIKEAVTLSENKEDTDHVAEQALITWLSMH